MSMAAKYSLIEEYYLIFANLFLNSCELIVELKGDPHRQKALSYVVSLQSFCCLSKAAVRISFNLD